jgi:hypothetical protein
LRKVGRAETIHTFIIITLLCTSVWQWKEIAMFINTAQTVGNKPIKIQAIIIIIIVVVVDGITVSEFD